MPDQSIVDAFILGIVEGLTEFIPVSSTGHILLLGHFLGFESTGKTFEVLIQLGAILAILTVYFARLWNLPRHSADQFGKPAIRIRHPSRVSARCGHRRARP